MKKLKSCLWEMANLRQRDTGLPMITYVSDGDGISHGPRIKVQRNYSTNKQDDMFSVSIAENPKVVAGDQGEISSKDLKKVFSFIGLNLDSLLKLWNLEITEKEFLLTMREYNGRGL